MVASTIIPAMELRETIWDNERCKLLEDAAYYQCQVRINASLLSFNELHLTRVKVMAP